MKSVIFDKQIMPIGNGHHIYIRLCDQRRIGVTTGDRVDIEITRRNPNGYAMTRLEGVYLKRCGVGTHFMVHRGEMRKIKAEVYDWVRVEMWAYVKKDDPIIVINDGD